MTTEHDESKRGWQLLKEDEELLKRHKCLRHTSLAEVLDDPS
jgi:hypothetical protein